MTLVLLGGGGHASDVLAVVEALATDDGVDRTVLVADDAWQQPERFDDRTVTVKLVETIDAGIGLGPFVVAVGYPAGRRGLAEIAERAGATPAAPLLHPDASIGAGLRAEGGAVVMGQSWVSAHVGLGAHTHVGYGATIGHDTRIGAWCSIMPCACIGGDVQIDDGVLVGANATLLQGVRIGEGAIVGAGATVIADVAPTTTVVGTPARARPVVRS